VVDFDHGRWEAYLERQIVDHYSCRLNDGDGWAHSSAVAISR
jgi:hypothetical protein